MILLSILAAFFLEGWRADRELAGELREELASVQTELERNQALVEAEIVALDRQISGLNALVSILDSANGVTRVSVPDTLAWLATGWNLSLNPSLGAVRALIASGRLAQVDNPELRLGLAGLDEAFADVLEEEIFARLIAQEQLAPLLGREIPLDFRIGNEFFGTTREGLTPQERVRTLPLPSYGSVEFPSNLPIRNAIVLRLAWLTSGRAEFVQLHARLEDLVELVSSEIQ